MDALAITGDEGRGSLRKATGSWQTSFDPQMSEWGNPANFYWSLHTEYIGMQDEPSELKYLSSWRKGHQPRLR